MSREKSIKTININLEKLTALELEEVTVLTNALLAVRNVREEHQNTIASNKVLEKSNLILSEENAKFVVENIELQKQIAELKTQLEKQQPEIPEVPQFVADWLEYCKEMQVSLYFAVTYFIKVDSGKITEGSSSHDDYGFGVSEENSKLVREWFTSDVHNQEKLAFAFITNFYTVKEKRFYLKHKSVLIFDPDSDDSDVDELYLGAGGNFVPYQHLAKIFTQSEIDSMETGSYEQIEVEE